jgi:hypothetical protein
MTRRRLAIAALIGLVLAAAALVWWKRGHGGGKTAAPASTEPDPWDTGDSADRALAARKRAARGDQPADASPASLAGHVRRAADGAPVAGAVVSVSEQVFGGALFNTSTAEDIVVVTDAAGAWTATRVPPGRWVVTATAPELLPASVDVELAPRARKDGIDLALAGGGITVSGTISDIGGGPVADARVTVRPEGLRVLDSSARLVAISGDDGRYRLTLPPDSWHATAAHADYAGEQRTFVLRDRPYTLDFTLTPGGAVSGVVVTRDRGEPVAGARVNASGGHGGRDNEMGGIGGVVTAADGTFTMRGLGSGALSLSASARGYASTDPTVVEVGIGEEVSGVQVVLDRAYTISGFVVRKATEGDGVPGVMVGVFSIAKGWNVFTQQPSAGDGYFEILGVRPATYMIAAMGSDVMLEIGRSITVEDRDLTDVIVTVDAGTSLSGVVVPPAVAQLGLAVDMKDVGLGNMFDVARAAMVRGASAADGTFTLRNAPRGTYKLVARAADGRSGELEVKITADDQTGLVVQLEPRGAIAGRVVDPGGKAVAGVKVRASGSRGDLALSMDEGASVSVTAPDGGFRVAGLEPGAVSVTVSDDQGDLAWAPPTDDTGATFTIAGAGTIDGVVLTVEARDGVIRGVVLGPDQRPAPDVWVTARSMDSPHDRFLSESSGGGVRIEVTDDDAAAEPREDEAPPAFGPGKTVLTGADGRFTITQLRRGTYGLVADATKGGVRAQKVGVKTGDNVTLVLQRLGTLSGTVTAAGAPVPRYDLDCDGPTDQHRRHVSSPDGRFTIDRLPAGRYRCNATADPGSGNAETRLVGVAGTLDIVLAPRASVTGVIVDAQGAPRAGLVVIATGEGDDPGEAFVAVMGGGGPTTDAQGRFTVGRLGPGDGQLMVFDRAEGFGPILTRPLQLTAGQRLDLGTFTAGPTPDPDSPDAGQ